MKKNTTFVKGKTIVEYFGILSAFTDRQHHPVLWLKFGKLLKFEKRNPTKTKRTLKWQKQDKNQCRLIGILLCTFLLKSFEFETFLHITHPLACVRVLWLIERWTEITSIENETRFYHIFFPFFERSFNE